MCWGFAFPHFDVIKGTAIDYKLHCICEGVVNQLLKYWFGKEKKNDVSSLFTQLDNVSSELISIKPPSELTRRPRKLKDIRDWKGTVGYCNDYIHIHVCVLLSVWWANAVSSLK